MNGGQGAARVEGDFHICRAGVADVSSMVRFLGNLCVDDNGGGSVAVGSPSGVRALVESSNSGVWVVRRHRRLVGMVAVQLHVSIRDGGRVGLLDHLAVASAYRRQGLGTALLEAAANWARTQGAKQLRLLVDGRDVSTLIFYRKRDWLQTNRIALRRAL